MHYPAWKYILIAVVLFISGIYALPNLYPDEPAVQITGASAGTQLTQDVLTQAEGLLTQAGLSHHNGSFENNSALLRLSNAEDQLKAQEVLRRDLGEQYVVALNLAQTTPEWLRNLGAAPMKLGLDLRGGVRFVLEVDMAKALEQRLTTASQDVRRTLRGEQIPVQSLRMTDNGMVLTFINTDDRGRAQSVLQNQVGADFALRPFADTEGAALELTYTDAKIQEINEYAVGQNLTTLRNRINELGVAEALVQSQGANRIVVELPGVQDTAEAKRVLGRTANLEFRMVSEQDMNYAGGIPPAGTEAFPFGSLDGQPMLLERQSIITGERVQGAQSGLDENGRPQVNITLDTAGGRLMQNATRTAVGKQMAVLFIENKQRVSFEEDSATGELVEVRTPYTESRIINRATIQAVLGSSFVITGLDSDAEAGELALLLRSGALAAPMYFVEERTIGPSLGQDNIDKGLFSTQVGYLLVFLWMIVFYRAFGVIANIALAFNVIMMVAIMSILGSSLTLPGIAGIVLTIGMAVDANVLIFERIREELANGARAKSAIVAGFDRAFSSIFDANITTLLIAFILFAIGTGPIKGFAITLAIGIISSLFTAILVTRAMIQIWYGHRKNLTKLSIG
ncbi:MULTISPECIES: protein translocase subunit SecD [Moraxella]|uniref:Protein translocase subunit SecD n=2 Tax=Bacteria TaxID=2 RepID=A0A198UDU0_MORCA|nr:protein translocase subunit SecD [Moraxella catarrhalis]OAU94598.1 Protein-export membrane protein SecD [Moraxella catarrhalis]OAU95593.1 Protein-export membrane protein SecD [Moraxella catarrhalis]OAU96796.1 Protein-export membrane protein SecD [Moraxella catarrhalis]OAV02181.1 Protein-export membrane protein SecD [Moraxella catarrhalis]STY81926.1 preprotein translocase subunit SecD [Moraxella catarrhalis]